MNQSTGATTLNQRGPGSNSNEVILNISQSSRTRALPSDSDPAITLN